jgi:hypothetical protein
MEYRKDNPGLEPGDITPQEALEAFREVAANLPTWTNYDREIAGYTNTVSRFLRWLVEKSERDTVGANGSSGSGN